MDGKNESAKQTIEGKQQLQVRVVKKEKGKKKERKKERRQQTSRTQEDRPQETGRGEREGGRGEWLAGIQRRNSRARWVSPFSSGFCRVPSRISSAR